MSEQSPISAAAGADYPGRMLGIVGLIVAIVANLIGLIISAIAYSRSKKAGYRNTPAKLGMIVGAALLALTIVLLAIGLVGASVYNSF